MRSLLFCYTVPFIPLRGPFYSVTRSLLFRYAVPFIPLRGPFYSLYEQIYSYLLRVVDYLLYTCATKKADPRAGVQRLCSRHDPDGAVQIPYGHGHPPEAAGVRHVPETGSTRGPAPRGGLRPNFRQGRGSEINSEFLAVT